MSQDLLSFLDEPEPKGHSKAQHTIEQAIPIETDPRTASFQAVQSQDLNDIWKSEPAPPSTSQPVLANANDEDDDFGDFEDASPAPRSVSNAAPVEAPVERYSNPSPPKPRPPTEVPATRSPFPPKAPPKPKTSITAQSPATRSPFPPKAAPKPTRSNIPISPKPPPKKETTGSHPFAGRMDLLFEADGDDYDAGADELGDLSNNPEAAMAYSKRLIAEQEESAKGKGKGKQVAGQREGFVDLEEVKVRNGARAETEKASGKAKVKDPNVLFDADDVSEDGGAGEDDDFGDFETWDAPATTATPAQSQSRVEAVTPGMDLLGLDDAPRQATVPKAAQTRSKAPTNRAQQQNASVKLSASSSVQRQDDDFWDDFESTSPAPKQQRDPAASQTQQDDTWSDFDTPAPAPSSATSRTYSQRLTQPSKPSQSHPDITPPTNIPPPLTLLTLFPPIFASADSALFAAMGKLDLKSRTMLLSHPASHQFLRGYLSQMTVLARIIAGRKLRWKRDQRLSQSMRIGPSVAGGGKGGMKLAGLDRSEVAKEEREVVDTVNLYRGQIGKLRSAVTAANAAPGLPKLPAVPEIAETMPVKALKQGEGGVTAREACVLCGLRREERVVRVDEGVEDSFGEWWIKERGMHVGCWGFWEEQERKLKGR